MVKSAWDRLIELAGATAGLAALIYFVGAATLWLRLRAAGYSPDLALEHASSIRLFALGLRGILVVLALALPLALAVIGYATIRPKIPARGRDISLVLLLAGGVALEVAREHAWVGQKSGGIIAIVLVSNAVTLISSDTSVFWVVAAIASAAMLALAATSSWRFFGITSGLVIALTSISYFVRLGSPSGPRLLLLLASLAVAVTAAAVAWQVEGATVVQAVRIRLKPGKEVAWIDEQTRQRCAYPYFGQSGDFVYVGEVELAPESEPPCEVTNAILEVPRDAVELRFVREQRLPPLSTPQPPAQLARDIASRAWSAFKSS